VKRAFDIFVSLVALVLLAPLLVLISLLIRLNMGAPVFYVQQRPGLHGRLFLIRKFRTMQTGEGDDGQRMTGLGRLLRRTSLDELPELFNVVMGDMSLVGPRPLLPQYLPLYSTQQARRHEVRPGITGWAQINGRNTISWNEKFELDVWYVDHRSFLLDVRILFSTIVKTVTVQGVSQEGRATVDYFTGNDSAPTREGDAP
jgi:lipopolysaccharide/colanic/teichoic acid biosynthesis glycosyltransferase